MRVMKIFLALVLLLGLPLMSFCADAAAPVHKAEAAEHEEGIPLKPVEIGHIGAFPITNSMLVTWIVAIGLIAFAQFATRNIKQVPDGAQNFFEWLVESLYRFLENIIGRDLVKKSFWFFATIFIFILFSNWFGLIPGVGTMGWGVTGPDGHFHLTS